VPLQQIKPQNPNQASFSASKEEKKIKMDYNYVESSKKRKTREFKTHKNIK
jgi:hypothetical protein